MVERFHDKAAAAVSQQDFIARFQRGQLPDNMPEIELSEGSGLSLPRILKESGLTASTSEAIRLIKQGGVRIDGERASDPEQQFAAGRSHIFQVGKRKFMRMTGQHRGIDRAG